MSIPVTLLVALAVQVVCQLFKLFYYSAKQGRLDFHYLVTAGGIPSAHTAFVTALTTLIAFRNGIGSDLFALSFVFSVIVIYDAYRLRGHVQKQAILFNRVLERFHPEITERLSEMVGHSIPEILTGLVFGCGVASIAAAIIM